MLMHQPYGELWICFGPLVMCRRGHIWEVLQMRDRNNDCAQLFIMYQIIDLPGIYLHEIQEALEEDLGIEVGISCICKFLKKCGFTWQRIYSYAIQRNDQLRSEFHNDVSLYDAEMLIFLDETGSDLRDTYWKKGYSVRGMLLRERRLYERGEHISCIAFISTSGLLDYEIVHGPVDGDTFYEIVQRSLLPNLMPFDGNNPHSVVIMDNAAIHHVDDVNCQAN